MGVPRVAIVGAGPAGLTLARQLQSADVDVIIVDGKGYHELNSGTLRVFLDPTHGKTVLIPYSSIDGIGSFLEGRVLHVGADSLQLESGAVVSFDWLVLAPGSTYADGPIKNFTGSVDDRQAVIQVEHERLVAAEHILVVGGGIVGVELAGEIIVNFPQKQVTLVCASERLIPDKPPGIGHRALDFLEKRNVKVLLSTRAVKHTDNVYATSSGEELAAELVYRTVGGTPNTAFLKCSDIPLDDRGFIKVNEFLQVEGQHNVFAIGDANNVKETKLGYLATVQARVAGGNLLTKIRHGHKAKMIPYLPFGGFEFITGQAMLFTLGRSDGEEQGWFSMWLRMMGPDGWFLAWLKAKDQYTGKSRRDLGLDATSEIMAGMASVRIKI